MGRDTESPLPLDACSYCGTRRTVHGWARWSRLLVPIVITLAVGGLGAAATSLARDAATRATVATLDERRHEAGEERRRLAAQQAQDARDVQQWRHEQAEQWRVVSTTLARIEARLDAIEAQQRRRP